jgi:hypothetical protein
MVTQLQQERLDRLREKHAEGLLLWELENGFELSPRESHLVFETAKGILLAHHPVVRGKVWTVGVEIGQSAGKRMGEAKKKEVLVTIDGGLEDVQYERRHGRIELRGMRLLRVIEEGIDQGVVFSLEDLGKLFGTSVRTVKRDVARLRHEGCEVQTRGYYEGIGRARSHKALIVEYYLRGLTYAQIENRSRHTAEAIRRYVETFGRVVYALTRHALRAHERSYILGISPSLLEQYQRLYRQARRLYPEKLKELAERYRGYHNPLPYKEIDRRKEGFRGSLGGKKRGYAHGRP